MSYTIEVYKGNQEPERHFGIYSLYVMFYPQLVAGPIERPQNILHQFHEKKEFDYGRVQAGLRLMLLGFFKKVVIADRLAVYVDSVYGDVTHANSISVALAIVFFAFQIYFDFSGYSDIALGSARVMGYDLMKNFDRPFISKNITEFWRRWHISLSSWFKDYVYIPLGGSRGGKLQAVRNTFIIFLLSGFWHGANWTFIFWGGLNAVYFLPLLLFNRNRSNIEIVAKGKTLPSFRELMAMLITFAQVTFAWIFFRAESLRYAFNYIKGIFSKTLLSTPEVFPKTQLVIIALFLVIEWMGREQPYAIAGMTVQIPRPVRWSFYFMIIFAIVIFKGSPQQFIYFQF